MRRHLDAQAATRESGVAATGVAQEFQNAFAANQHHGNYGIPWFSFTKVGNPAVHQTAGGPHALAFEVNAGNPISASSAREIHHP